VNNAAWRSRAKSTRADLSINPANNILQYQEPTRSRPVHGLLHALLLIQDQARLSAHPSLGASWEGFCIEQIISLTHSRDEECFTWSVQSGPEVDFVLTKKKGLFGFECKASDAPQRTSSMITAVKDLSLAKLFVIYPGEKDYRLDDKIEVVGFKNLSRILPQII
jgi:hypothetical protein